MLDALPGRHRCIRVGYVDAARGGSVESEKRLSNLIETTREGRIIHGIGGIDVHYGFEQQNGHVSYRSRNTGFPRVMRMLPQLKGSHDSSQYRASIP